MKERGIIFSAPMVQAILEGRKTQTRRLVKPAPAYPDCFDGLRMEYNHDRQCIDIWNPGATLPGNYWRCPFGRVGDRLWVRETFSYRDYGTVNEPALSDEIWYWADGNPSYGNWTRPKPCIHMPAWASRITLEVMGVRVERLQEISNADALIEGGRCMNGDKWRDGVDAHGADWPRYWYRDLWNSIHGEGAWDENPWVWVIEFKKVNP